MYVVQEYSSYAADAVSYFGGFVDHCCYHGKWIDGSFLDCVDYVGID